jgi:hypothetical protein
MADRLRALLEHPLDPSVARAILVCSSAILLGLAALFVLAATEPGRPAPHEARQEVAPPPTPVVSGQERTVEPADSTVPDRRQDPQDEEGSAAARRAARAIRSHRALQQVPYRDGELAIVLVGARGQRAVLRISAPTVREARRGWRRFLRRYGDSGTQYTPRFTARRRQADG